MLLLKVERPDESDAILFESIAICEYLNETEVWAEDAHPLDITKDAELLARKKDERRRTLNSPFQSIDGPP